MKHILLTIFFLLTFTICAQMQEKGWDAMSELPYSYAYARSYLGHQMRKQGWRCVLGFTSGQGGKIEHSIWEKDGCQRQLMIWRIDTGRTGYSWKNLPEKKDTGKDGGCESK